MYWDFVHIVFACIFYKMPIVPKIDLQNIGCLTEWGGIHLMKCFFIFFPCSLTLTFFPSITLQPIVAILGLLSSWWEKLTLLTEGEFELDSSQSSLPPPEPVHQTPSTPLPSATAAIRTSDLLSAVCMTKKAFLVRVFEKGRTKQRGRSSPFSKRRSIFK